MKHIKLLPDIVATVMGKTQTFKHAEFILGRLQDPTWGSSTEYLFAAYEIKQAVKRLSAEAPYLSLENDHHKKLVEVTEAPSQQAPYNPIVAVELVPFIRGTVEAIDEIPPEELPAPPPAN